MVEVNYSRNYDSAVIRMLKRGRGDKLEKEEDVREGLLIASVDWSVGLL